MTYMKETSSVVSSNTVSSPSALHTAIVTSSLKSVISVGVEVVSTDSYVVDSSGGGGVSGGGGTKRATTGDSRGGSQQSLFETANPLGLFLHFVIVNSLSNRVGCKM